ncbi:MAG: hypothetical protein V1880_00795 [Patescibacteria group bacterium]
MILIYRDISDEDGKAVQSTGAGAEKPENGEETLAANTRGKA